MRMDKNMINIILCGMLTILPSVAQEVAPQEEFEPTVQTTEEPAQEEMMGENIEAPSTEESVGEPTAEESTVEQSPAEETIAEESTTAPQPAIDTTPSGEAQPLDDQGQTSIIGVATPIIEPTTQPTAMPSTPNIATQQAPVIPSMPEPTPPAPLIPMPTTPTIPSVPTPTIPPMQQPVPAPTLPQPIPSVPPQIPTVTVPVQIPVVPTVPPAVPQVPIVPTPIITTPPTPAAAQPTVPPTIPTVPEVPTMPTQAPTMPTPILPVLTPPAPSMSTPTVPMPTQMAPMLAPQLPTTPTQVPSPVQMPTMPTLPPTFPGQPSMPLQIEEEPEKEPEIVGIDTMNLEKGQGNWLFKRIWYERAQEKYEKIRTMVDQIWDYRSSFFTKRSEIDRTVLDPFYLSIGLRQGELQEILTELISRFEEEKKQESGLNIEGRDLIGNLKNEQTTLENLHADMDVIIQLDHSIDESLDQLMKEMSKVRTYEREAWEDFKKIAYVLDDIKAREHYYKIDIQMRNIKDIQRYLQQSFSSHFDSVIARLTQEIERVKTVIQKLKEQGIDFKKQAELLFEASRHKELAPQQPAQPTTTEEEEEEPTPQKGWMSWFLDPIYDVFGLVTYPFTYVYELIFGGHKAAPETEEEEEEATEHTPITKIETQPASPIETETKTEAETAKEPVKPD